jgi:hypothetical protein
MPTGCSSPPEPILDTGSRALRPTTLTTLTVRVVSMVRAVRVAWCSLTISDSPDIRDETDKTLSLIVAPTLLGGFVSFGRCVRPGAEQTPDRDT